ncbi:MAG: TIM barrel protein [Candidatus Lokiarchaeota archaeon]|nr:TIM barrel protein [Candidatus Lokiarchaeota archaeon]
MPVPLDFFSHFVPAHTVDFTTGREVDARVGITSRFLDAYPVADVGFEFVVFPGKLTPGDIGLQVQNFRAARGRLEDEHRVKVHASMHFPTANNTTALFLGADDPETRERILGLFDRCLDLALEAGIRTIVVHSGANIDYAAWARVKGDYGAKRRQLRVAAGRLQEVLDMCAEKGYGGELAWENVPWPFDIPDALSYTNLVAGDFRAVLSDLDGMAVQNAGQLGICVDLCHSWIIGRVARHYGRSEFPPGRARVPPGVFAEEERDFLALAEMNAFVEEYAGRIVHVHLADSAGEFEPGADGGTCKAQPSEGAELGTGDFSRSPEFTDVLGTIAAGVGPGRKVMCTLEVKDADFARPEKAYRSLLFLGKTFYRGG